MQCAGVPKEQEWIRPFVGMFGSVPHKYVAATHSTTNPKPVLGRVIRKGILWSDLLDPACEVHNLSLNDNLWHTCVFDLLGFSRTQRIISFRPRELHFLELMTCAKKLPQLLRRLKNYLFDQPVLIAKPPIKNIVSMPNGLVV